MSFTKQKINKDDLILKDWERYLDPTEKAIFNGELEDYDWYAVLESKKVIAIFQIIDVLGNYSKNLEINFHPKFEQNDHNNIIDIILFIYASMLLICGEKEIKKLKLYIDNSLIHDIFMTIATYQEKNKDIMEIKNYSKWIEIQMY